MTELMMIDNIIITLVFLITGCTLYILSRVESALLGTLYILFGAAPFSYVAFHSAYGMLTSPLYAGLETASIAIMALAGFTFMCCVIDVFDEYRKGGKK